MNSNITNHNLSTEPYGYSQIYLIQSKDNPFLLQDPKMYTVTEPVLAQIQPVNDSLKAFYENSINLVGQLSQTSSTTQLHVPQQFLKLPQQRPNIEEFLVKGVTQQKEIEKPASAINLQIHNAISTDDANHIEKNNMVETSSKSKKRKMTKQSKGPSNRTSVHLLKVGAKYHSLSQLSDEQMRLVKQALQSIGDPEKVPLKPTYDAATNTRIIYKVVAPNDLKVVGNNKIVIDDRVPINSPSVVKDTETQIKTKPKKVKIVEKPTSENVVKVTRSGRAVKVPKHVQDQDMEKELQRNRKKSMTAMSCMQCSSEFSNVYKLQHHYKIHPSHMLSNTHVNLFHCLLSIVNSGKTEDKTSIFLEQLEELITKLKSILPCLLKKFEGVEGTFCRISEDVGRLFGMSPGKYNLNIDALNCIKENDGSCTHNPPKVNQCNPDLSKPSQVWLSKHIEETATDNGCSELCARTNSIDKWPPFTKRIWKYKQALKSQNVNKAKKRHLTESVEIDLDDDNPDNVENETAKSDDFNTTVTLSEEQNPNLLPLTSDLQDINTVSKKSHVQFRSAHFDIRSSPIKNQQSGVFNQFQINSGRISSKFKGQLLRPSTFTEAMNEDTTSVNSLESMLTEFTSKTNMDGSTVLIDLNCKNIENVNGNVCYNEPKDWIGSSIETGQSLESYDQANACIQPTMIHIQDNCDNPEQINNHVNDIDSCLSLPPDSLNDCITFQDNELQNDTIEQNNPIDLFTFNNP